jgi:hypothetical protein
MKGNESFFPFMGDIADAHPGPRKCVTSGKVSRAVLNTVCLCLIADPAYPSPKAGDDKMLRIDKKAKRLVRLTKTVLAQADHWERATCKEVNENRSLRFHLISTADFTAFSKAMEHHLPKVFFG